MAGGGQSAAARDGTPPDRTRLWLISACVQGGRGLAGLGLCREMGQWSMWPQGRVAAWGGLQGTGLAVCPRLGLFWILNLAGTRPSSSESSMMPGWGRLWCLRWGQWDSDSETDHVILAYSPAVDCSHRRLSHRFPSPGQCRGFCPCLVWPGVAVSSLLVTHSDPVHFSAKVYGLAGPVFITPGSLVLTAGITQRNSMCLYVHNST